MVQSHFACCLHFDLLACAYVSWRFTSLFSVYSCFNFSEEKSLICCKNTKQNRRKIFILLLFTNTSNSSWSKVGVKFLWDEVMRGNAAKYKKNIWLSNFSSFQSTVIINFRQDINNMQSSFDNGYYVTWISNRLLDFIQYLKLR